MKVSRLVSATSAVVLLAACASLVGFEELDFASDAGVDAPSGTDGPSPPGSDAGPEAAADAPIDAVDERPSEFCTTARDAGIDGGAVLFCDDFERTTPIGVGWSLTETSGSEALELSTAQATSGTRSAYAALPAGANDAGRAAFLQANLDPDAGPLPRFLDFEFYIEKTQEYGTGEEFSGFLFAFVAASAGAFALAAGAIGDAGWNPFLPSAAQAVVVLPLKEWHHVSYRIDSDGLVATFTPSSGGKPTTRTRSVTIDAPPNAFWVGASVGSAGGPVKVYFDDVVVHR
jgi:hypothetical protein